MEEQTRSIRENLLAALEGYDDEYGEDEDMANQGSDTARTELDELCELSMNRLYDLWLRAKESQKRQNYLAARARAG